MFYETRNITSHVIHVKGSNDSQCSRALAIKLQLRVHIVTMLGMGVGSGHDIEMAKRVKELKNN